MADGALGEKGAYGALLRSNGAPPRAVTEAVGGLPKRHAGPHLSSDPVNVGEPGKEHFELQVMLRPLLQRAH